MVVLIQIRTDEDGFLLEPLEPGVIMAQNYIRMRTMISLCNTESGATIPDLINIVARYFPSLSV